MRRLTQRQAEVLTLVAAGLSSKIIAARLAISKKVVDEHCSAACKALGASNRLEAALRQQALRCCPNCGGRISRVSTA